MAFSVRTIVGQDFRGKVLKGGQLVFLDGVLLALGEAVDENRPIACPENDPTPESACLRSPGVSQALLDDTTAEIGGNPCLQSERTLWS